MATALIVIIALAGVTQRDVIKGVERVRPIHTSQPLVHLELRVVRLNRAQLPLQPLAQLRAIQHLATLAIHRLLFVERSAVFQFAPSSSL